MRILNRKGQFVPLTTIIAFTSVLLMIAGMNIYRISKAKLQTQNMADAAALSIAAMQAKAVNTIIDRNEWLNHMYGPGYQHNSNSVPNISDPNKALNKATAQAYANLVATINKAQLMFIAAYNNFLGAPSPGGVASNGSGTAALADILSEIDGLQDPSVISVWVSNNQTDLPSPQEISNTGNLSVGLSGKLMAGGVLPLKFRTENVNVKLTDDDKGTWTLTQLMYGKKYKDTGPYDPNRVGWMHPDWDQNTLDVQVSKNAGSEAHWGASVTIVKLVPLKFFPPVKVTATSLAYVVNSAGTDVQPGSSSENAAPPVTGFRPTFFARLAYHQ